MRASLLLLLIPTALCLGATSALAARPALAIASAFAQSPGTQLAPATTQELIAQYQADRGSLGRLWPFPFSEVGLQRMQRLQQDWLDELENIDYAALDARSQIDWHLLRNMIEHDLESSRIQHRRDQEAAHLVPFVPPLVAILEAKSRREEVDPREMAEVLTAAMEAIKETRSGFEQEKPQLSAPEAQRVSRQVNSLRRSLQSWVTYRDGYDPVFTWWCAAPWRDLNKALESYAKYLTKDLGGIDPNDQDRLIGNPIGREALLAELAFERIAYTPEELLEIAQSEFEWCMEERRKAADEMGLNGDWREAQEVVKKVHPSPGSQPAMIHFLAEEAIEFLEARNLMTIPELAKESWRMQMMTPERQKFSPYFTGGEVISISYPTDTMSHEAKMMTMRGNNYHYSRATVQHELIPGHHMQGFMADRWAPHRQAFYTPFLVEGWALYWEMRLWNLDFPATPDDKIGMLFWRTHRCARIMFSLNFHLGNWTPEECVDFLVENVGHERRNATAEVRRSIQGGYGPLYQAAYMLGGLQVLSLHRDLVEGASWSERDFHDAILRENSIPVEYIRAALKGTSLPKDNPPAWRFYH